MRTIAYVDGYNFFYGCLQGTSLKWLDIGRLLRHVLHVQDPSSELVLTRYFTSRVIPRFSSHGLQSEAAQLAYIRAISAQPNMFVAMGRYTAAPFNAMRYCRPPRPDKRVSTWRLEEKETDVSLALWMYRDASKRDVDQIILVSNDSDLGPALCMIREDFPSIKIGLVIPSRSTNGSSGNRAITDHLERHSDWTREHILESELRMCQLPDKVKTGKKPAVRPSLWTTLSLPGAEVE